MSGCDLVLLCEHTRDVLDSLCPCHTLSDIFHKQCSALAEVPSYFYILKVMYAFFSETGTAIKSCENTSELLVGYILENKIFKLLSSDAIALSPTQHCT